MCGTCGCSESGVRVSGPGEHGHEHGHLPEHEHEHEHDHDEQQRRVRTIELETDVLAKNDALAQRNRQWLRDREILTINLMSSPGSGKTTLLERTLREIGSEMSAGVVEGDQETLLDANRLRATGCRTVQVNTGAGCHLDAEMLAAGVRSLQPPNQSVVFVENVGNLVCPALFDLGEQHKVVVSSVTEGEDKPLKYPYMFRSADLVLLNKVDLLAHLEFSVERFVDHARQVNPEVRVMLVSATHGEGMSSWYDWLRAQLDRIDPDPSITASESLTAG